MPGRIVDNDIFRAVQTEIDNKWDVYSKLAENGCVRNPLDSYIITTYPPRTFANNLSTEQRIAYSNELTERVRNADKNVRLSGYIHFPFCSRKCTFCHYVSVHPASRSLIVEYLQTLSREMDNIGALVGSKKELSSLFIGGGSPSVMTPEDMYALIDHTRKYFEIPTSSEISLELHPEIARQNLESYLRSIKYAGVNRVNVGLQTADQKILDASNRGHNVDEAIRVHNTCKEQGFVTNIDLIWGGLFGDNTITFLESLELAFSQGPDTVTTYHMWLKPGTPDFQRYSEKPYMYPNWLEILRGRIFANLVAKKHGYIQECTDWYRKPGGQNYRQQRDKWSANKTILLGFGPSAYNWDFTTSDRNFVYWHSFDIREHQKQTELERQLPIDRCAILDCNETTRRHIIFRLKSGGIEKTDLNAMLANAPAVRTEVENKINKLVDFGLLECDSNVYGLTNVGSWIGDEVASVFTSENVLRTMENRGTSSEEKRYEWYVSPKMIRKMRRLLGE